jgi:charged multivesicular body protein 4A/B
MSSIANFLLGKSKPKLPTPNFSDTIEKNNQTTLNLQRKIDWIETKYINPNITKIKNLAKKKTKKDNENAKKLLLINRKYNTQIKHMQAQIDNLLSIRIAIEGSLMTKNVFDTIQESTNALRSTMPSIDNVEDVLADTEESISQTNEITEALSTPIQFGMPVDPDDLEDELRELMNEECENIVPELNLPNVPTTQLPKINVPNTVKPIDNELAELLAFVN